MSSSIFADNPDFWVLGASDDYSRYFATLTRSYKMLLQIYGLEQAADSTEAEIVSLYLTRLLYTTEALRLKYSHMRSNGRLLWVDVSDSGFPNAQDISMVGVDLLHREERLRELPSADLLKQMLLDHLFQQRSDSSELLWQLSERSYLSMLKKQNLFLSFNLSSADIRQQKSPKGKRTYLVSWGSYDFKTNRPYIHLMTFDQDTEAEPLTNKGANHLQLLEVLQAEGSRVPDIGVLALAIDDALETIHPKIVKRICFGPLFSELLLEQEVDYDEKHLALKGLLADYAKPDDFVMFITHEVVFSKRQRVTQNIFAPNGKVREIFHLPDDDPETYARRASVVQKYALVPHALAQHLDDERRENVPELRGAKIMSYDAKDEVYGQ